MEMPVYKWPSFRTVVRRMLEAGWSFVKRAGTFILATMVLVWALLYFPHTDAAGISYQSRITAEEDKLVAAGTTVKATEDKITETLKEWADLKTKGGDPKE